MATRNKEWRWLANWLANEWLANEWLANCGPVAAKHICAFALAHQKFTRYIIVFCMSMRIYIEDKRELYKLV